MARVQVRENLVRLLERLPDDKAELLLKFAVLLSQEPRSLQALPLSPAELELSQAEEYWFSLPETTRRRYRGQTVAVTHDQIVDADADLSALRRRVSAQHPGRFILYIEADAEREPVLQLRRPRLE